MASDRIKHFADTQHLLLRCRYGRDSPHVCDICRSRLAGLEGYRCGGCDMDFHEACAGYFKQSITFFAHPWHALTLTRVPPDDGGRSCCDVCTEACPPGSFVYRCAACLFDAHPLCTMLPQTVRSPLHAHPGHDLRLVPSSGRCSACRGPLPVWHYVCHCRVRLHIACVSGAPAGAGGGSGAAGDVAAASGGACGAGSVVAGSSQGAGYAVGRFLLKASLRMAVHAATSDLASPVLDVLAAAFDSS